MTDLPAGPITTMTRCVVCRIYWRPGQYWRWLKPEPGVSDDYRFAGYFCSVPCAKIWRDAPERFRSEMIFAIDDWGNPDPAGTPDPDGVMKLRDKLRMLRPNGRPMMARDTEADPRGVPIMEPDGNLYRMAGYREAQTVGGLW